MKKILLTILFSLIIQLSFSQNLKKIDSLFQTIYKQKVFNGNVLISKNHTILFKKSYGFANNDTKELLTNKSIFNLASLTKQFTAAAIVLLKRNNKLNYSDDIRAYIPELDFYPKITIEQLLH